MGTSLQVNWPEPLVLSLCVCVLCMGRLMMAWQWEKMASLNTMGSSNHIQSIIHRGNDANLTRLKLQFGGRGERWEHTGT